MSTKTVSTNNDRKLPLRALVGFPMLNVAATLQMLIQMYFLLMFYTNFVGISATAAALIVMIARIWDFINDPLMGVILEKSKRPKKSIFFMRCAIVPTAIFIVLCYSAPNLPYNMKVLWSAVTFICLGMSQTVFSIAKDTLRPKLTSNGAERAKLNTYDSIFNTVLNAVVPAITMPLVGWLSGFNPTTAFTKIAAIYAIVYIIVGFAGTYLCEPFEPEDYDNTSGGQSLKASDMFKALAINKPALCVLLVQVVKMLFSSIGGSVLVYFCTYNLGNVNAMSIASTIQTFVGLIPVLLLVPLYKKFGNAGTGIIGAIIGIIAFTILFISGVPSANFYIALTAIGCLGTVTVTSVIPQCLMDCIDYGEWKTGHKNTGIIMSAYGIGTKIGLAFGTTVAGLVIGAVNFDPNAATQPKAVLDAFFHLTITGQLVVYVVMLVLLMFIYKIEKQLPQMKKEIEERKAAQQVNI